MKGENFQEARRSNENEEIPKNQKSFLGKMSKLFFLPNYFKSEWSFAQFRIPDLKSICAFGPNNTIIGLALLNFVLIYFLFCLNFIYLFIYLFLF